MTLNAETYEVVAVAVAVAAIAFAAIGITVLLQIKKTFRAAEDLCAETKVTVQLLNGILVKGGEEIGDVAELIRKIKNLGFKVTGIADTVVDGVKGTLLAVTSLLLGVKGGLKSYKENKTAKESSETDEPKEDDASSTQTGPN
jgi:hypothetical protein